MKLFGLAVVFGAISGATTLRVGSLFAANSETALLLFWGVALLMLARSVRGSRAAESIR